MQYIDIFDRERERSNEGYREKMRGGVRLSARSSKRECEHLVGNTRAIIQYIEVFGRERERAPQENRSTRSLQFSPFAPTSGRANIPLSDVECDVDIAHVSEVRT